ncbi:hypothetical protein J1N35_039793 [Gossypium stocksii]|uniref:Uncharacterized protein n=1 Tax=Gossypium stocksii TaxID=47602 RepID=A0A9D3ZH47_9ROSI|nr:hypothetical protein J1N35_039793 [Gossypium stocksii]
MFSSASCHSLGGLGSCASFVKSELNLVHISFLQNLFILIRNCSVCEMAKKELIMKPSFLHLFLVAALVLSSIMVTSSRFSWSTCDPACQMELARTRRVLEKQDYSGYVPSPDDYDYNGFYRRQGDVPSPGIGH